MSSRTSGATRPPSRFRRRAPRTPASAQRSHAGFRGLRHASLLPASESHPDQSPADRRPNGRPHPGFRPLPSRGIRRSNAGDHRAGPVLHRADQDVPQSTTEARPRSRTAAPPAVQGLLPPPSCRYARTPPSPDIGAATCLRGRWRLSWPRIRPQERSCPPRFRGSFAAASETPSSTNRSLPRCHRNRSHASHTSRWRC